MTSVRCYYRFILAAAIFGAVAAIAGLTLLILSITTPGTICLIAGAVIGLIAAMEWRCRERPIPVYIVKSPISSHPPPPHSVVIAVQEKPNIK